MIDFINIIIAVFFVLFIFLRFPFVSGFYKMLEIVMKLSRKLNYFKVRFVFEILLLFLKIENNNIQLYLNHWPPNLTSYFEWQVYAQKNILLNLRLHHKIRSYIYPYHFHTISMHSLEIAIRYENRISILFPTKIHTISIVRILKNFPAMIWVRSPSSAHRQMCATFWTKCLSEKPVPDGFIHSDYMLYIFCLMSQGMTLSDVSSNVGDMEVDQMDFSDCRNCFILFHKFATEVCFIYNHISLYILHSKKYLAVSTADNSIFSFYF